MIEKSLANLTSESFGTNVIVIAHVQYQEDEDGVRRGYPKSVGSGPKLMDQSLLQFHGPVPNHNLRQASRQDNSNADGNPEEPTTIRYDEGISYRDWLR